MIKVLIGALLMATTSLAQTTTQSQPSQSAKQANVAERPSGSTESTTRSKAKTSKEPVRPLPQPSLKTKLESRNTANPNYQREKNLGGGSRREYTPRRTASGARKDTLIDRRKKQ